MTTVVSLLVGLGLAAAAGFRVFVPLLVVGLAQRFDVLHISDGFAWMGTTPALVAFGAATLLEILGYYVPWVDHLLDTVASPAAVVAGVVLTAAVITDLDPMLRWTLAVVAGGGTATIFQGLTAGTRGISTVTTGGLANPLVSTAEAAASTVLSALAIFVPVVAAVLVVVLFLIVARRTVFRRRRPAGGAAL
jgi:hypothetical protein